VLLVAAVVGVYFYSAWWVARDEAVAIAAGDRDSQWASDPFVLGSDLPHESLQVRTLPGWFELSRQLAFSFDVVDTPSGRSVDCRDSLEVTTHGWQVVGVGTGG
jgi:hypothetical protein